MPLKRILASNAPVSEILHVIYYVYIMYITMFESLKKCVQNLLNDSVFLLAHKKNKISRKSCSKVTDATFPTSTGQTPKIFQ